MDSTTSGPIDSYSSITTQATAIATATATTTATITTTTTSTTSTTGKSTAEPLSAATSFTTPGAAPGEPLPLNRFELELEFVQSLASPAYLHFLATSKTEEGDRLLFQDPQFLAYLKYLLGVWSQPAYSRYLSYPHSLYFLELLLEQTSVLAKEWTLPEFRNFCHQQQFLAWQHRHAVLYGIGLVGLDATSTNANCIDSGSVEENGTKVATTGQP